MCGKSCILLCNLNDSAVMRNTILCSILLLVSAGAFAQSAAPAVQAQSAERVVSIPKTDLLSPFSKIEIDGPMNVTLKQAATGADVKIVYDTKGCTTSRFKATVNKDGVLRVEERIDQKRESATDVTVYYNRLTDIKIMRATAVFENTIEADILDLTVAGGATVKVAIRSLDAAVDCTGRSAVEISGSSRYFRLNASSSKVDARNLDTVASIIDASHNAEVRISVSERLEASTSTSAKLLYNGKPTIVREHTSLFGGDIIALD